MTSTLTAAEATAIVERFGFQAREVPKGFFLAPVTKNSFGHRHLGDDQMLVSRDGVIVPYADDAQAFLAAKALAAALAA